MAGIEQKILGIVGIFLGIFLFTKYQEFWFGLWPLLIGLALIIFNKAEGEIEERRDKKSQKK